MPINKQMSISELKHTIIPKVGELIREYQSKYGNPRYIKLPEPMYDALKFDRGIYVDELKNGSPEVLCGLVVCPTKSISTIDEIEVF